MEDGTINGARIVEKIGETITIMAENGSEEHTGILKYIHEVTTITAET